MSRRLLGLVSIAAISIGASVVVPTAERPLPSPESVIGFAPCSDYKLATYEQIAEYFRALDAASERMQLFEIGTTTEGRTQLLAVISSEDNLRNLERYKRIARALALNRDAAGHPLTAHEARQLANKGKTIVWVNFGLHSTEVAHVQTAPWLAWQAVNDERQEMRAIRDNVILVLVPDMNPDGTTMVAEWYGAHAGRPWELSLPWLYQKYAGHDNNRDWFMFTQAESRNAARQLYQEYLPQIVYDHHQTAPFPARIFVPPFVGPVNVHIPSAVLSGIDTIGEAITSRLDAEGKVGAISGIEFDAWWNGGMRTAPYFHNMVGILTETGHASPTPAHYDPARFPQRFSNGQPTLEPRVNYPKPYRGGRWTIRDSCEYMVTASIAVLDIGARRRQEWLYNAYQMASHAMREGLNEAYIISDRQWDTGSAVRMVNALRMGGVEVERATAAFSLDGRQFGAGSFIVRGSQPFLPYVRDLLTPQRYPVQDDRPSHLPYDISGWTLNLQMGVDVHKTGKPVLVPTDRVTIATPPPGRVTGIGASYLLDPRTNDAFTAINRLLKAGETVFRTATAFDLPSVPALANLASARARWPAGTFVVAAAAGTHTRLERAARDLGLVIVAIEDRPTVPLVRLRAPRVGVYAAWGGNTDEGWTRWLLEQYEFAYVTVRDAKLRAGNLRADFDVILLPDATYRDMLHGVPADSLPDSFIGGMTEAGVEHLRQFVLAGGTLVAQDSASELPLRAFGLPVHESVSHLGRDELSVPGALLRIRIDSRHPIGWGLPEHTAAFVDNSPAFELKSGPLVRRVASYSATDMLMSGWLRGEHHLRNKAAVVEATVGMGRVALLGFRTHHRGQSHSTFKLLFNAIYLGNTSTPALDLINPVAD